MWTTLTLHTRPDSVNSDFGALMSKKKKNQNLLQWVELKQDEVPHKYQSSPFSKTRMSCIGSCCLSNMYSRYPDTSVFDVPSLLPCTFSVTTKFSRPCPFNAGMFTYEPTLCTVTAPVSRSFWKQMTLNVDLDLSKVNDEIWHGCWTSVPNFMKITLALYEKSQQAQKMNVQTK